MPSFTSGPRLSVDHEYSVVIMARGAGNEDLHSSVVHVQPVPNNILTVHGIPANSEIKVSAILSVPGSNLEVLANLLNDYFTTVAVGYRIPGTGMFVLYGVDEYEEYDPTRPYRAVSSYRLLCGVISLLPFIHKFNYSIY